MLNRHKTLDINFNILISIKIKKTKLCFIIYQKKFSKTAYYQKFSVCVLVLHYSKIYQIYIYDTIFLVTLRTISQTNCTLFDV